MTRVSHRPIVSVYNYQVSSTARTLLDAGFTQAQIDAADALEISVRTAEINTTNDGTTPTGSASTDIGHTRASGWSGTFHGNEALRDLKMIRRGSTDARVSLTLYGFSA